MNSNRYYHVFNRANGWDNLFENPELYQIFLEKSLKYITPVASIQAYCLIPNHFHFLVKIHDEETLRIRLLNQWHLRDLIDLDKYEKNKLKLKALDPYLFINQQFSNLFNSFAQIHNFKTGRKGNLFQKSFKTLELGDTNYLMNVVRYIHTNPIHHNITSRCEDWRWSSYLEYYRNIEGIAYKDDIIRLFGGINEFLEFHQTRVDKEGWDF